MPYLMGIDLGTSSLKTFIVDLQGGVRAENAEKYQFDSPRRAYAEQSPRVWWDACCSSVRGALAKAGLSPEEIKALSFSGQMHGAVLLDKDGEPVRPAILHCDARSTGEVDRVKALLAEKNLLEGQYNPIYTGFLLVSLLWVREREPQNYERVRYVLLPKDFLKLKLCGEICSDYSDASATLAFDIERFAWSREVLETLGVPGELFPPCFASDYAAGGVTERAAAETGLKPGTIVVNGGGDQIMQAIGNKVIKPGQATVNIGSSGQVCFQTDAPIRNPRLSTNTFCGYAKNRWITMGAVMTAGLSLKWIKGLLDGGDYQKTDEEIAKEAPGSGGLIFLPYLNGERTPHMKADLSGAFMGLNFNTGPLQMVQAVMEGVVYSLNQCIEVCAELGLHAGEMIASGGGARSPVWLQMQADVFNVPLKTTVTEEQAGLGAAAAAGAGAGIFGSVEEACGALVHYRDRVWEPDAGRHRIYEQYYRLFKESYAGGAQTLQSLSRLGRQ